MTDTIYETLKSAWKTKLDAVYAIYTDTIDYQTAIINLDCYILALTTEGKQIDNEMQSYSISGDSVTIKSNFATNSQYYLRKLEQYIGRGVISLDNFNSTY